ncbi:MAG: trigger factor [Candidatus Pacebacteria bacterium]|nr:trigger factor [Candidatus Paceibacterota bacterium]
MNVKIEKKSETQREIEVTIPLEDMKKYLEEVAEEMKKEVNVKGFRPGKASFSAIENTVGKEKLYEEAAKKAVQATYPKVIQENDLFAISSPEVNLIKCVPGNEVIYKALVYVMPEVTLPDYKKIGESVVKKEGKEIVVTEQEIDASLQKIRETKAETKKVEREAKKGDVVVINFKGLIGDEEDKKIEEENFKFTIGEKEMDVLEGFEENVVGMKAGEEKDFSIEVKGGEKDRKELSGKKIDFNVKMVTVMEKELPKIDDELAKTLPNIKDLSDLKEKIKEGIEKEKQTNENEKLKMKVLEELRKNTKEFEIPEILVERELDNMIKNLENQINQNGSSLEDYLKQINKTEDDLKKEWRKKAEENISYALILHYISKEEGVEATDEEIEEEVEKYFKAVGREKEKESDENLGRLRAYISDTIKNRKVFNALSLKV